jgi:hypothetical protein
VTVKEPECRVPALLSADSSSFKTRVVPAAGESDDIVNVVQSQLRRY